ncbi:MAG: hypothetical protein WKF28_02955 [Rubrobacteraceae bacterium]
MAMTIVIMGILLSIATSSWFGLVEGQRVTSATNQLASDLRLAHTKSANQLAIWRVVLVPNRAAESVGPDYYLVKLDSSGNVIPTSTISRTLPDNVRVVNDATLNDSAAVTLLYTLLSLGADPSRTLEFEPDGSMRGLAAGAGSDTVEVTEDNDPRGRITFIEATSRIKVEV